MATLESLYELLYLSAYEFNSRCKNAIEEVYDAHEEESPFHFFEFFLSQPLSLQDTAHAEGWEDDVWVLAPFASRMAEHSPIIPYITDDDVVVPEYRSTKVLRSLQLHFPWRHSALAKDGWKYLCDREKNRVAEHDGLKVRFDDCPDGTTGEKHSFARVLGWNLRWQRKYHLEMARSSSSQALLDLYTPLFKANREKISSLFAPIASRNLYYGGIWVMLPGIPYETLSPFRDAVGLGVARLVQKSYLPALTVLHQHWMEKLISERIDRLMPEERGRLFPEDISVFGEPQRTEINEERLGKQVIRTPRHGNINYYNPFMLARNAPEKPAIADHLEDAFCNLWARREGFSKEEEFEKDILFDKYIVSSEIMIRLLLDVIKCAKDLRKSHDTLPACLVVGGAGSGKEKLAKMLKLFSDNYRNGERYTINMASIRPAPLTSALMVGAETLMKLPGADSQRCGFNGMLQRICGQDGGVPVENPPTIILDEFNSMDADSQGVLLRFLDNSEIVPLGAIKDEIAEEETDCLIIGVLNENPDDISREHAMEFFRKDSYLGKFIGDLLYEHFMQIRRLRPDIKYRMIRNGKFIIPPLRERGEDIPMLFHVFVRLELINILKSAGMDPDDLTCHLPLDVLDRLTSPSLLWPGNVRQLQALSKLVAAKLYESNHVEDDGYYTVKLRDLEQALVQAELVTDE